MFDFVLGKHIDCLYKLGCVVYMVGPVMIEKVSLHCLILPLKWKLEYVIHSEAHHSCLPVFIIFHGNIFSLIRQAHDDSKFAYIV